MDYTAGEIAAVFASPAGALAAAWWIDRRLVQIAAILREHASRIERLEVSARERAAVPRVVADTPTPIA